MGKVAITDRLRLRFVLRKLAGGRKRRYWRQKMKHAAVEMKKPRDGKSDRGMKKNNIKPGAKRRAAWLLIKKV